MKICTYCKEKLPLENFRSRKGDKVNKDGKSPSCLKCELKKQKELRRSYLGKLKQVYHCQVSSSKRRGYEKPKYTLTEFIDMFKEDKEYKRLYDDWKKNNYDKKLAPSFDRLNDYETYSFENFNKWMTFEENNKKYHSDSFNGINTKQCKAVIGTCLKTGIEKEYHSIAQAKRETKASKIYLCVKGEKEYDKGYKWRLI